MTDQELRALVRDAVQRHLGARPAPPMAAPAQVHAHAREHAPAAIGPAPADPSHALYVTLVNTSDACVIEPAVPCSHCNYCRSHGH
jgi:hypothetical protein